MKWSWDWSTRRAFRRNQGDLYAGVLLYYYVRILLLRWKGCTELAFSFTTGGRTDGRLEWKSWQGTPEREAGFLYSSSKLDLYYTLSPSPSEVVLEETEPDFKPY